MSCSRRTFLAGLGGMALAGSLAPPWARGSESRRLALVVDLNRCRGARPGCDLCRQACHSAHNVPSIPDPAHEIKWIWDEEFPRVFPTEVRPGLPPEIGTSTVPVLCNHCANPPCVRVCPTGATFVKPNGIVGMDEHRCIGCRYCMSACPYGSRSFNFVDPRPFLRTTNTDYPTRTRGVVEKCTFCEERLASGKRPACVEACPAQAMTFGDIGDPAIQERLASSRILRRRPELGTSPYVFYIL
jgi:molybdopterin-containing oxidoreductase family iron-sulfur binding subunit